MSTTKKSTLFTVYLGLVSLISFIWLSITVIIFAHSIISKNIITDDEYITQNHREIERCDEQLHEPMYMWNEWNKIDKKTSTEIEECITKAKNKIIGQRNVEFKETIILSWLRAIILLIIFPLHFIYFRKYNK